MNKDIEPIWEFGEENETPVLSILILTIHTRKKEFRALVDFLSEQAKHFPNEVEIISFYDEKEMRIGPKRDLALGKARGLYVQFWDDDDWASDDYFFHMIPALKRNTDGVGFKVKCEMRDINGKVVEKSNAIICNRFADWYHEGTETIGGEVFNYRQFLYHKSPIRRELALRIGFKDMRMGEDYDFGKRLKPLIKRSEFINKYLYYYNFRKEPGGPNKRYAR